MPPRDYCHGQSTRAPNAGSVFPVNRSLLVQLGQYLLGEFHDFRHPLQEDVGAGKEGDLVTGPLEPRHVDYQPRRPQSAAGGI